MHAGRFRLALTVAVVLGFILSQLALGSDSLRTASWGFHMAAVVLAVLVGFVVARWKALSLALMPLVLVALGLFEGTPDSTASQVAWVFVLVNAICICGGVLAGRAGAEPSQTQRG